MLLSLGRISGAHGLRGGVKVRAGADSATTDPEDFLAIGQVLIGGRPFRVKSATRFKFQVLLYLEGVTERDQAEALAGQEVMAERRRFPALPDGEYYWFELLGLPVYDACSGSLLGELAEIMATAAHDVYLVRRENREALIPAVEGVVVEINLEAGYIKVDPPPGLLALYAD